MEKVLYGVKAYRTDWVTIAFEESLGDLIDGLTIRDLDADDIDYMGDTKEEIVKYIQKTYSDVELPDNLESIDDYDIYGLVKALNEKNETDRFVAAGFVLPDFVVLTDKLFEERKDAESFAKKLIKDGEILDDYRVVKVKTDIQEENEEVYVLSIVEMYDSQIINTEQILFKDEIKAIEALDQIHDEVLQDLKDNGCNMEDYAVSKGTHMFEVFKVGCFVEDSTIAEINKLKIN